MPEPTSVEAPGGQRAGQHDAQPSLRSLIARLTEMIANGLGRGEVADLRRMAADDATPAAFWKLFVSIIEPAGWAPATGPRAAKREAEWATILNALAIAEGFHSPQRRLGQALAEEGFSEIRFARLLTAQGQRLADEVRLMARFLASKGASADLTDAAWLVLSDESEGGENLRRRIARDYYAHSAD